ncbi:MAG: sulfotransferase domain-containing protein [Desulfobulbaceae bacterium]|nr:sulfotransferase domain-containing protein [Desulfobulbaceae bacterium]
MPRSGSMWVFNILRQLLVKASFLVIPENVPKSDQTMIELAKQGLVDPDPQKKWVLKVHTHIKPDIPRSVFITTYRDVRDALVSWMRFMHSDFDTALKAALSMTHTCDYYTSFPEDRSLKIDFYDIKLKPVEVVCRIARFLSLDIAENDISTIVEGLTKERVKQMISDMDKKIQHRVEYGQALSKGELTGNLDGSVRGFDPQTGFQSGHVSSYNDGDWRMILSGGEKKRMNDLLGPWLQQKGYLLD